MQPHLKTPLVQAFLRLPEDIRRQPATESELHAFEQRFGPIPEDFRWFLAACGGGAIGTEWIDGIKELPRSHQKFSAERGPPRGWTLQNVFIIGWDGAGNPFGIERSTGQLLVEDHTFGGIHELSPSFEAFLVAQLLIDV